MIRNVDVMIDGLPMRVAIALPEGGMAPQTAIVLFTDIGGPRECFDRKAQVIADWGYAVYMPNIHYRATSGHLISEGKSVFDADVLPTLVEHGKLLTASALARDSAALLALIDEQPRFAGKHIGVVGYCRGGSLALRMAAYAPDRVLAAAGFHSSWLAAKGDLDSPAMLAGRINARVYLGHADKDSYLPSDQIGRMDEALASASVHFMTELYKGAMHSFTVADSPAYNEIADNLHLKRLQSFFKEALQEVP